MTYVITQPCEDLKDATCVEVCPVECIKTTPEARQYYIDPEICIECEQCAFVCPVDAIFIDKEVPAEWSSYIDANALFFQQSKETLVPLPLEQAEHMLQAVYREAARCMPPLAWPWWTKRASSSLPGTWTLRRRTVRRLR